MCGRSFLHKQEQAAQTTPELDVNQGCHKLSATKPSKSKTKLAVEVRRIMVIGVGMVPNLNDGLRESTHP